MSTSQFHRFLNRRFSGWRTTCTWGVRTLGDSSTIRETVRKEINTVDADVPASMQTMDDLMEVAVAQRRLNLWLVRVFGISALTLAAAGIYAVTAFSGVDPSREIGIRAALGARQSQNFAVVIADVSTPLLAGLAAGVLFSLAGGPALGTLLFAVNPVAPVAMTMVSVLLLAVGMSAAILARGASNQSIRLSRYARNEGRLADDC